MGTTIAVLNQKGGVGKSMVAQNLAACAHLAGRKTLLRDGDVQGSSGEWYRERAPGSPLAGLYVDRADDPRVWQPRRHLEATEAYDVVVCDGPPSLGPVTLGAAYVADVVVLPMRPGSAEVCALVQTRALLDVVDQQRGLLGLPPVRRVLVLNEVAPRSKEAAAVRFAVRDLGFEVWDGQLARRVAYDRARGAGEAVVTHGDDADAAREVRALYAHVLGAA